MIMFDQISQVYFCLENKPDYVLCSHQSSHLETIALFLLCQY